MRLIDADELLTAFPYDDEEPMLTISSVRMTIRRMPTIEAEPVVRCKDCFYRNEKGYCNLIVGIEMEMDDDDYCSRAERKEE